MKSLLIPLFLSLVLFGCGGGQKQSAMLPSAISNPGTGGPATPPPPTSGSSSSPGATTQCAAGEYDMLDWATMDPDLAAGYHLEGNANPLYTVVQKDRFYWLKSASGYPWDI